MTMINIRHLDVVFGDRPQDGITLLDQGLTRDEIKEKSGVIVGVQDANITVNQGEICVLMGLSGSGKSSLLRAINGLNPVTRGTLEIQDQNGMIDLATCSPAELKHLRSNRISMVFQRFALMPWLNVLDNVAFGLEMKGIGKKERRDAAMEKLEMVGLADWALCRTDELSGGMQQRVGLARAFAMDTDILLMDEPFSALDPLIRAQLQDELIALQNKLQKTIIFVSHDLDEALKIGSKIAIMESARIIQHGEPEDIVLNPATPYVEDFVSHTNPLNVLAGQTLMQPVTSLVRDGDRHLTDKDSGYWIKLDQQRQLVAAGRHEQSLPVQFDASAPPKPGNFSIAPPDINMRDAINLRYQSGLPVLIGTDVMIIGVLRDQDFYHALLGKHFTREGIVRGIRLRD